MNPRQRDEFQCILRRGNQFDNSNVTSHASNHANPIGPLARPDRAAKTMNQAKTRRTAIVLIPPQSLWPAINQIRSQYDPAFPRWMPHITLIYPFRPQEALERLLPIYQHACKPLHPFEIELTQVTGFPRGKAGVIYLAPQPAEPIQALQRRLQKITPDCNEVSRFPDGFTPHLTIAKPKENYPALLAQLQAQWQPQRFPVTQIALIARGAPPNDPFQVIHQAPLLGEPVLHNPANPLN